MDMTDTLNELKSQLEYLRNENNYLDPNFKPEEFCRAWDLLLQAQELHEEDVERLRWLDALEAAGVDNWQGIDFAHDLLREES